MQLINNVIRTRRDSNQYCHTFYSTGKHHFITPANGKHYEENISIKFDSQRISSARTNIKDSINNNKLIFFINNVNYNNIDTTLHTVLI